MLRKLLIPGIISGVVAGILLTLVQYFNVVPLILEAEIYETQIAHSHDSSTDSHINSSNQQQEWAPQNGSERTLFTLMTNTLLGIGFSLLLISLITASKHSGWQSGILWGLAGFCVFYLAPGLNLPPELPGTVQSNLEHRQLWWVAIVISTAIGIGLLFLNQSTRLRVVGVLFIVAPHFFINVTTPQTSSLVPEELTTSFIIATTLANVLFWLVIGILNGILKSRYSEPHKILKN